ncbi:SseB family protein [Pseudohalocynthiibacter aestuariivivens]|uniref:SseB family protein n=1 Tax=Roseovarius pelagicus TaxID=2980108 RepID=A0ABY6DFS7_9RHOB|nr:MULTISPECIES: SseB family protein [Rhodobacterales]QIE46475.1 SseB family protein [Pseudohalocynthiibacter aestuariivivens]UXX85002.1 SseB family protein [Roseovarius pelagicus]
MNETPLDTAHAAMQATPEAAGPRMAFYHLLADTELFLLLETEAQGTQITPQLFAVEDGQYALVFDSADRLAEFAPGTTPFAALPGRVLVVMLAAQQIGLGVNLEVASSSILIPPDAVTWLAETLDAPAPDQIDVRAEAVGAPGDLPEALLTALDATLARTGGLAHSAYLAGLQISGAGQGHLLAFVDAVPGAEPALVQAISEALVFSGIEAGALDVGFVASHDEVSARLARVGLRFDLPKPETQERPTPAAPGTNPDRPPILK